MLMYFPLRLVHFLQELRGLREGEDPEDGAGEEGVTFDLWKNTELPPPPEPVFDEVPVVLSTRMMGERGGVRVRNSVSGEGRRPKCIFSSLNNNIISFGCCRSQPAKPSYV